MYVIIIRVVLCGVLITNTNVIIPPALS